MCMLSHSVVSDSFEIPWAVAHHTPLFIGFSRQEYWSGLPIPSPGNLPNPGIKPESSVAPALAGGFFTTEPPGKPLGGRGGASKLSTFSQGVGHSALVSLSRLSLDLLPVVR